MTHIFDNTRIIIFEAKRNRVGSNCEVNLQNISVNIYHNNTFHVKTTLRSEWQSMIQSFSFLIILRFMSTILPNLIGPPSLAPKQIMQLCYFYHPHSTNSNNHPCPYLIVFFIFMIFFFLKFVLLSCNNIIFIFRI